MSEQPNQAKESEILQILITEHTNLQAVRSATIFEANGRTNLYLGTVSSVVVALAFIGQATEMSQAFLVFSLILLPSLLFIGVVTFVRVYQTGIEDMVASRGINRIRHYYTEIAPHVKSYFILSTHDDMQGMLRNMGAQSSGWWQLFVSTHGLVSVINSILAAVFVALLTVTLFKATLLVCIIAGVVIFGASVMLHLRYQSQTYVAAEKKLKVLFPSEDESRN
jgi:hypothetical protein